MTPEQRKALLAYLIEMKRHHTALAKAAERLLVVIQVEKCYTKSVVELKTD